MIQITNIKTYGWVAAIRGMRNPMNSWGKSDSGEGCISLTKDTTLCRYCKFKPQSCDMTVEYIIGPNDLSLMLKLAKAGSDHAKYRRVITVTMDILAPLYWWKEFDTYKVGTVANSCSTMHKIAEKEFTLDDFSHDKLIDEKDGWVIDQNGDLWCSAKTHMETTVNVLNAYRYQYLKTKDKKYWWQLIQLLPSSYNQLRTVQLNYEVLANIYRARLNHKLDEWVEFCKMIETLPYSEIITFEPWLV